jgi:hypothetical protein
MNSTPTSRSRAILHHIGTEPRHFTFWLAFAGLLAIAISLAAVVVSDDGLPGIEWLFLAGVLAFLLGAGGFVIAWLPPVRRLFARLLRHKLILAATLLATLVVLFYAVENWRGRHAWQTFVQQCAAEGIYFDLDKIVPPPIPAADNMFAAPPWDRIRIVKTNGSAKVIQETWFDISGPKPSRLPDGPNFLVGRRDDFKAWQDFYRYTNSFPTSDGGQTNFFQLPATPSATPAQDVLRVLSRFDGQLQPNVPARALTSTSKTALPPSCLISPT